MTIQVKRVAAGILAASRLSGSGTLVRLSNSSDWFESRSGTSPDHANHFVLSLLVESTITTSGATEELAVDLFDSDDPNARVAWNHVAALAGPPTIIHIFGPGLYEIPYSYPAMPTAKPYFRLQFSIDDVNAGGSVIPYPASGLNFTGTCWVSVVHV